MDIEEIEKALDGLRKGLQNDGADLVIDRVSEDDVRIKLILKENACQECIVETDVLIAVVEAALREVVPAQTKISLEDPRMDKKTD